MEMKGWQPEVAPGPASAALCVHGPQVPREASRQAVGAEGPPSLCASIPGVGTPGTSACAQLRARLHAARRQHLGLQETFLCQK